eukprot:3396837-Amphidinium_carterae.1
MDKRSNMPQPSPLLGLSTLQRRTSRCGFKKDSLSIQAAIVAMLKCEAVTIHANDTTVGI